MAITDDFHAALDSPNRRESLRRVVERQLETGIPRDHVVARLEELRGTLREAGREADEDVVLEVLDFVTGWCSPHVRLEDPAEPQVPPDQMGRTGAKFVVYADKSGHYRWRLISANGQETASSGQHFASRSDAERDAQQVKEHAMTAEVVNA